MVTRTGERGCAVPRKAAAILFVLLSPLLPTWSTAAAFVPAGAKRAAMIPPPPPLPSPQMAVLPPDGGLSANEALDSLAGALMSPVVGGGGVDHSLEVMDKIALLGQNLANFKDDLGNNLDGMDRSHERLFSAALVVWVGVAQRRAGRESYKAELVNRIASGEVSTEEVMKDITVAAEAAIAHKRQVEQILEQAKIDAEQRKLDEEARRAEAKLALEEEKFERQRLAREQKEMAVKRMAEMKVEAQREKEEKRALALQRKEEAEKRIIEAKVKAEEARELARQKKVEEQERKKAEQVRMQKEVKAAKEAKLLEQKLKKEEQVRIREEAKAAKEAKLLEQRRQKEEEVALKTRIRSKAKEVESTKKQSSADDADAEVAEEQQPRRAGAEEWEKKSKELIAKSKETIAALKASEEQPAPLVVAVASEEFPRSKEKKKHAQQKLVAAAEAVKAKAAVAIRASPLARIIASEHGLDDLSLVAPGSGKDGRVLADDVREFLKRVEATPTYFFANATAA